MGEHRKHHYVPVFFQKHFTNNNGLLWVYDRRRETYQELAPKVVCCQKDLYAVKKSATVRDQRVESIALATADRLCALSLKNVVNTLITGTQLPDSVTLANIAYFAGLQSSRLPSAREFISSAYGTMAEEFMRLATVNVERMKSILDKYSRETGEAVHVSPESMIEAVRGKHLEVKVTEQPFIEHIFKHAEFLARMYSTMSWEILTVPGDTGFLLCDSPLVIVPPRGCSQVGIGIPGTVKYLPLARSRCLRMGDYGRGVSYRSVDGRTVEVINCNIAANSERFIMGSERSQLEQVIADSASLHVNQSRRFVSAAFDQTDSGSTQMLTQMPGRYFYLGDATRAP